jgi:uncharacterized OB-fold protein
MSAPHPITEEARIPGPIIEDSSGAPRTLPAINDLNRDFWFGGAHGELRIMRCQDCGNWIHPARPMCPFCRSRAVRAEVASGRGTVYSYAVNHRAWRPGLAVPYVIALVELEEQAGLRLTSNIVGCEPADVSIGLPVKVCFVRAGDAYVPLFAPDELEREPG